MDSGYRPRRTILHRLERLGLIEPLPADDRRHPYRITASGAAALRTHLDSLERVSAAGRLRLRPRPRRRRRRRALAETGIIILVAVLLAGLIRTFAFQTFWIPGASMVPTLGVYDRVLVQKAFFAWRDVRGGDIVVFSHPPLDQCPGSPDGDLVKRVIALPGQTIYSSGNSIYIDGRRLAEPYLPHDDPLGPPIPGASRQHPYQVPPGDNRADSCDSRYWGPIEGSTIIGKVVLTFWHDGHPDFRSF